MFQVDVLDWCGMLCRCFSRITLARSAMASLDKISFVTILERNHLHQTLYYSFSVCAGLAGTRSTGTAGGGILLFDGVAAGVPGEDFALVASKP